MITNMLIARAIDQLRDAKLTPEEAQSALHHILGALEGSCLLEPKAERLLVKCVQGAMDYVQEQRGGAR